MHRRVKATIAIGEAKMTSAIVLAAILVGIDRTNHPHGQTVDHVVMNVVLVVVVMKPIHLKPIAVEDGLSMTTATEPVRRSLIGAKIDRETITGEVNWKQTCLVSTATKVAILVKTTTEITQQHEGLPS
jgi:hypothetical protein